LHGEEAASYKLQAASLEAAGLKLWAASKLFKNEKLKQPTQNT
jgi:hypothetical protein